MKLLILLTITFSLNFSLLTKNSSINSQYKSASMIQIIEQKSTELYHQGKQFVALIKNDLMFKIDEYNQFIQVAILGNLEKNKNYISIKKRNHLHSSGNSQTDITKKNYSCYL